MFMIQQEMRRALKVGEDEEVTESEQVGEVADATEETD